jgi:ferredoxin
MGAWTVDTKSKTRHFEAVRCVGCGLCFAACDKEKAIELKPVTGYEHPEVKKVQSKSQPLAGISGIKPD